MVPALGVVICRVMASCLPLRSRCFAFAACGSRSVARKSKFNSKHSRKNRGSTHDPKSFYDQQVFRRYFIQLCRVTNKLVGEIMKFLSDDQKHSGSHFGPEVLSPPSLFLSLSCPSKPSTSSAGPSSKATRRLRLQLSSDLRAHNINPIGAAIRRLVTLV